MHLDIYLDVDSPRKQIKSHVIKLKIRQQNLFEGNFIFVVLVGLVG